MLDDVVKLHNLHLQQKCFPLTQHLYSLTMNEIA